MRKTLRRFLLLGFAALLPGAASALAQTESLDELYKRALKEEGVLNCYCSLAQINAEKIYSRSVFPGLRSTMSMQLPTSYPHARSPKREGGKLLPMSSSSAWKISTRFMNRD